MPGIENDIVGRPTIFGDESFTQNGDYVGTLSPSLIGDGYQFTGPTGESLFTTLTAFNGSTQFLCHNCDFGTTTAGSFDIADTFSGVDAISSQVSVADFGSATDAMDGLDVLGMF